MHSQSNAHLPMRARHATPERCVCVVVCHLKLCVWLYAISNEFEEFGMPNVFRVHVQAFVPPSHPPPQLQIRKRTHKHGWIAKDMTTGPQCSLKQFEIDRIIGMGLMGVVRIAKWKKDNTFCVLKVCSDHRRTCTFESTRKLVSTVSFPQLMP